jgi:hypothetical protein
MVREKGLVGAVVTSIETQGAAAIVKSSTHTTSRSDVHQWRLALRDCGDKRIKSNARLVGLVLSTYAGASDPFPAAKTIAAGANLSEKTVGRALAVLIKAGWIDRKVRGRNENGWQFVYALTNPLRSDKSSILSTAKNGKSAPQRMEKSSGELVKQQAKPKAATPRAPSPSPAVPRNTPEIEREHTIAWFDEQLRLDRISQEKHDDAVRALRAPADAAA